MYYIEHNSALTDFLKEDRNSYTICVTEQNVLPK